MRQANPKDQAITVSMKYPFVHEKKMLFVHLLESKCGLCCMQIFIQFTIDYMRNEHSKKIWEIPWSVSSVTVTQNNRQQLASAQHVSVSEVRAANPLPGYKQI